MSHPEQVLPPDTAAVWSALRPYLVARLGSDAVDKLDALITTPSAMLAEPQTRMRLLRELAGGGDGAPLTAEQMSALMRALPVLLSNMSAPKPPPAAGAEAELVGLLAAAEAALDPAAFRDELAPLSALDVASIIPSGFHGALDPEIGFEVYASLMMRAVSRIAERWYKPMLLTALRLSLATQGTPLSKLPNTLGAIVRECEKAWPAHVRTVLVDRVVVLVRNSEAHEHTEFDGQHETVILCNEFPDGQRQYLGMNKALVARLVADVTNLCTAMWSAYARFRTSAHP